MDSETPTFDDSPPANYRRPWFSLTEVLVIIMIPLVLAAILLPAVQSARDQARRAQSKNNLKQIGLAFHNYHDVHNMFPSSAIVDSVGNLHHGWMYSIVPFLDSNPLYDQIESNYPWNDERNVQHFKVENYTYLNPAISKTMSKDGFGYSHYSASSRVLKPNGSLAIGDITDGASETLMAGEINEGFKAWGTPANVRDPAQGHNNGTHTFGSPFAGGVHFLLADGHVRFIPAEIDPQTLKALATPDAGNTVEEYPTRD